MVQMDCELRTPPEHTDSKMFKTPTPKIRYNLRSKVIWMNRSDRRSRSCTPMSFSPASTPGRRNPDDPSAAATPNSLKLLSIDLRKYNESSMKTPTRSAITATKTPPCRPSKKRTRIFLSKTSKARKSIGKSFFASAAKQNESPGTQLSRFMQGCAVSKKSPRLRRFSPNGTPRVSSSAKRSARRLHSMGDKTMFLKRPKPGETEDDLLQMQESWQAQKEQTGVQIYKIKSKSNNSSQEPPNKRSVEIKGQEFTRGGRFEIDLEDDAPTQVLCSVEEKNVDLLKGDRLSELTSCGFDKVEYSKEGGFPLALDLTAYYSPDSNGQLRRAPSGKSFFATEFDRLHGNIDEATCSYKDISAEPVEAADYSAENDRYISKLDVDKIIEMQKELQGRLDSKTIAFIKNRHKEKDQQGDVAPVKISKFKKEKLAAAAVEQSASKSPAKEEAKKEEMTDDYIKELEVLGIFENSAMDDYKRLATDAIQMDITAKCIKSMLPRQEQNALKLFDNLKDSTVEHSNPLVYTARAHIDDIKLIYLEEVETDGRRVTQFSAKLNPILNTCWTLRPIRSVIDAVVKRETHEVTPDDVEIVRLSLLWTFLLFTERASMFYAFAEPKEFYVRLTEVFLLGSEIMEDDIAMRCVDSLMDSYVLQSAIAGRIHMRLDERIAGLDAFAPFFDDLLNNYESYSMGNVSFARAILIGAYLNSSLSDGLMCQFSLFSPKKNVARQIVAKNVDIADILSEIRRSSQENALQFEDEYYQQYVEILGAYAAAIRDEKITRDRNQLMFTIASEELGRFVNRHATAPPEAKDFDMIVDLVRLTVQGKLEL